MNRIATIISVALLLALGACGHKRADEAAGVEEQNSQLEQALAGGDLAQASVIADSMALFVDDLTPDEAVSVLKAFVKVQNRAVAEGKRRQAQVTMRKFVDVYDIAVGVDREGMHRAVDAMVRHGLDLDSVFNAYRDRLSDSAWASQDEPEQAAPRDTAATDTATITTYTPSTPAAASSDDDLFN